MDKTHQVLTASQVLVELERQEEGKMAGCEISRLTHALQAATRARRDGADDDWIIGALLHDIGGGLAPNNHDRFSAEVVRPFVREEVAWVVEHHGIFQVDLPAEQYAWDADAVDRYREHIFFQSCADFSARWDQTSLDPNYEHHPLASFASLVEEIFARPAFAAAYLLQGVAKGLPVPQGKNFVRFASR